MAHDPQGRTERPTTWAEGASLSYAAALRAWRLVGLLLVLVMLAGTASAQDLTGTAWIFTGSDDYDKSGKLDRRHAIRGRRGRLAGSSCCQYFVVVFPTNDRFSLRHEGYVVATGGVQRRRSGLALVPDAESLGTLLWWLENEIEFFWNVGVTDLSLNLQLMELTRQSMVVTVKNAGGDVRRALRLGFRFRGEVRGFDRARVRRFAAGPVRGEASFREKGTAVMSIADLEELDPGYPLPPVRSCEELAREEEEFFATLNAFRPAAWRRPDFCRR